MLNAFKWFTVCTLVLLLLTAVAAFSLFLYALEPVPSVPQSAPADYTTVADAKAFVKRIKMEVDTAGAEGATLAVTEQELDHLARLGSYTFKWVTADVAIDGATANATMSVRLPGNPFGNYLNLGAQVLPSRDGVAIEQLCIGTLCFSGRWFLPLAARMMDILLRDSQASDLLAAAKGIEITGDTALVSVLPPPDVKADIKRAVRTLQAYRLPDGEPARVTHYYNLLVEQAARGGTRQSLAEYLTPLMAEAVDRSEDGSAVDENRSAIWAMVIFFSNGGIEAIVGKLVSSQRQLVWSPENVTLAGRRDLTAHFLTSAGILLASQQGISIAAGEFKELMDSGPVGSGFSFVDLAADRAGIAFVNLATASEAAARQLQAQLAARADEASFFPHISGLPEELNDEQFRLEYRDVESVQYQELIALIDQRIAQLPIYRSAAAPK